MLDRAILFMGTDYCILHRIVVVVVVGAGYWSTHRVRGVRDKIQSIVYALSDDAQRQPQLRYSSWSSDADHEQRTGGCAVRTSSA